MTDIFIIIAGILLIIGATFSLLGSIGLLRFPDVYSRMHAASKAGTVGSGFMLLAVAFVSDDLATSTRAVAGIVFLLLTAPISAHLLAKAAYEVGYSLWKGAVLDEMKKPNSKSND